MLNGLKSIRRERAELELIRVKALSMYEDARLADLISENIEDINVLTESVTSKDLESIIDRLPESEEEDSQIEKILTSDDDLDIDGILGVSANSDDPFEL